MTDLNLLYRYGSASIIRSDNDQTLTLRGRDQEEWAHELGHYLLSTPRNRQLQNVGMGQGVIDPIPGWSKINAYKNEVGACVLSFAIMHWAGCRLERPSLDFSKWDFDNEDEYSLPFRGNYGMHIDNTAYVWNSRKAWCRQPYDFNTAFWIGAKTVYEKGFIFRSLQLNLPRVLKEKFRYEQPRRYVKPQYLTGHAGQSYSGTGANPG